MENIKLLKRIDFFAGLSTIDLTKINRICRESSFEEGEEIVREGEECDSFFIIKNGSVNVVKGEKTVSVLSKGSPLGEVSFIDKGPRSATAIASKKTVLIEIQSKELDELLKKDIILENKVYRSIALILCKRLRSTNDLLLILSD
jgi:CRP-like cAMP-binding protein